MTGIPDLDVLESRRFVGVAIANTILTEWLPAQPIDTIVWLDFDGTRAMNLSVAEELGPLLMKATATRPNLERRYPIYRGLEGDVGYTLHRAFQSLSWSAPALFPGEEDLDPALGSYVLARTDEGIVVALGALTPSQAAILRYIDERFQRDGSTTSSSDLAGLGVLGEVKLAARSKRLSELRARGFLALDPELEGRGERHLLPVWRLGNLREQP
ncbi:MAG: hypothetical protein Q8P50_18840 [Bacillota bacterium]|nr:hypothetical protein [Bacillota bacterium]